MKTGYFTAANIERKAHQMLSRLAEYRQRHVLRFRPRQAALMIIDMQRYFLDEDSHAFLPSAPAIIPGLKRLADGFKRHGAPVIFTRHTNNERNARMLGKWWSDLIPENDELSDISPELPSSDAIVIGKNQYDAFYETGLEGILKERGVTQVVVTGVMAHLCCESTARSAFVRGFEVIVAIDGMATENEDFHTATLGNLSHGFAIPVLIKELAKYLEL